MVNLGLARSFDQCPEGFHRVMLRPDGNIRQPFLDLTPYNQAPEPVLNCWTDAHGRKQCVLIYLAPPGCEGIGDWCRDLAGRLVNMGWTRFMLSPDSVAETLGLDLVRGLRAFGREFFRHYAPEDAEVVVETGPFRGLVEVALSVLPECFSHLRLDPALDFEGKARLAALQPRQRAA